MVEIVKFNRNRFWGLSPLSKIVEEAHFSISELATLTSELASSTLSLPEEVHINEIKRKVSLLSRKIEIVCSSDIAKQEKLSLLKEMQSLLKKVKSLSAHAKKVETRRKSKIS